MSNYFFCNSIHFEFLAGLRFFYSAPWEVISWVPCKKIKYASIVKIGDQISKLPSLWGHFSTQRPTMKLNKRSLPKPTTTTGWKLIPHRSKLSMNWNPLHWDPIIKYVFKVFFRLTIFFSGTKKICPRNNFCSVFNVL